MSNSQRYPSIIYFSNSEEDIVVFLSEVLNSGNFILYLLLQGTDRLCKVVKLSMRCCGKTLKDSFETYKTFPR